MLTWRTELEHSEIRAEAALVTILSLTQITELKLILDCGSDSHRFYSLVLALLITAIALEVLVGTIIIYIGGIHRAKPPKSISPTEGFDDDNGEQCHHLSWRQDNRCWCCCFWRRHSNRRSALRNYKTQDTLASASGVTQELLQSSATRAGSRDRLENIDASNLGDTADIRCCPLMWYQSQQTTTAATAISNSVVAIKMNRLSSNYTVQQSSAIRLADLEFQLTRVRTQVDSLEGAIKRGTATSIELDEARRELVIVSRLRDDAETNRKLTEARHQREVFMSEFEESQRQMRLFVRVSSWQNVVTYLVYGILLLNVVVTTFGMSGDKGSPVSHLRYRKP